MYTLALFHSKCLRIVQQIEKNLQLRYNFPNCVFWLAFCNMVVVIDVEMLQLQDQGPITQKSISYESNSTLMATIMKMAWILLSNWLS